MIAPQAAAPRTPRSRAVVFVVTGLAVAGALIGGLWALLAPPARGVIALTRDGNRVHAYLGNEADNFFTAAFMMAGMLAVLAVVSAVLVWQWRAHRGPVMVAALSVGMGIAAGLAGAVGSALVRRRYGVVDIDAAPVSPQHRIHYLTEAPQAFFGTTVFQIATGVLFPVAIAAMVYALMAVAAPRDDLGGWPPQGPRVPVASVAGTGPGAPVVTDRTETAADVRPAAPTPPGP